MSLHKFLVGLKDLLDDLPEESHLEATLKGFYIASQGYAFEVKPYENGDTLLVIRGIPVLPNLETYEAWYFLIRYAGDIFWYISDASESRYDKGIIGVPLDTIIRAIAGRTISLVTHYCVNVN